MSWEFTLHRSLLCSQVPTSVRHRMGCSTSRASGCGSSQPQPPFLVPSSSGASLDPLSCWNANLPREQGCPSHLGTPEPQPTLTGQLGLPSGVPTRFCEGSQCPFLLGDDIPGHRDPICVLVEGGKGLCHHLPQTQLKRGMRAS